MNSILILTVSVSALAFLIDARLIRAILSLISYFISNFLNLLLGKSSKGENWVFTPSSSWSTLQGRIRKAPILEKGYENLEFDIEGRKFNMILGDAEKIMNIKWMVERYNRGEIFCRQSYNFFGWFMFEKEDVDNVVNNILSGVCYKAKFGLPVRCYKEEKVLNDEFLKPLLLLNSVLINIGFDKRLNYILISFSFLTIFLRGEIYSLYIFFKKIIVKSIKIMIVKFNLIRSMLIISTIFPSFENCEENSNLYVYNKQKTMLTLNGFNLSALGKFKVLDSFENVKILGTRIVSVGDSIFKIKSYKQEEKIIYNWVTEKGPFTDVYKTFNDSDLRGISKFEYIIRNLGELMSPVVSYDGIMSHKQNFREFLMSDINEYTIINLENPKVILFSDKLSLNYRESLIFNSFKLYYGERNSRRLFLHNYHFFGKNKLRLSVLCSTITCVGIMKEFRESIGNCKYKLYRCHVKNILKDSIKLRLIENRYLMKAPENPSILYCNDESHEIEIILTKPMIIHNRNVFKHETERNPEEDLNFDEIEQLASCLDSKKNKQVMSLVKQLKNAPDLKDFPGKKIEEIKKSIKNKKMKIQKIISEAPAYNTSNKNKDKNELLSEREIGSENPSPKITYKEALLINEGLLQKVGSEMRYKILELDLLKNKGLSKQEGLELKSTKITETERELNAEVSLRAKKNAEFISSIDKQIRPRGYLNINSMVSLSPKLKDYYQKFKETELEKIKHKNASENKKSKALIKGILEDDWNRTPYPSYIVNAENYFTGLKVSKILRSEEESVEKSRIEEISRRLSYLKGLKISLSRKKAMQKDEISYCDTGIENLVTKLNKLKNDEIPVADKVDIIKSYKGQSGPNRLSKGMSKLKSKTGLEHYGFQINRRSFCLKMNELETRSNDQNVIKGHLMNKFLRIAGEYNILGEGNLRKGNKFSDIDEEVNYARTGEIIYLDYGQN